jgi:putative spermidine/putrescine transport system permease protein
MIGEQDRVRAALWWGGMLIPAALLLLPFFSACIVLVRYSFDRWSAATGHVSAWELHNYAIMLGSSFNQNVLLNTLTLGAMVTAIGLVGGYPVAYALVQARKKSILILLVVVPLWMDVLIRAYGWIVMLSREGLVNVALVRFHIVDSPMAFIGTRSAVVLDLLHETLPFTILSLYSVLQRQDPALRDAAMNLGANRFATFLEVTLPLSVPGIMASTVLAFSLAISAFAGPLVLGGGKVPMMSLLIFQQMTFGMNWPLGAAEAVTLMVIVLTLLLVYSVLLRRLRYRVA